MASRAAEKKPVGIATQLTAGGIAGAMEAVRTLSMLPSARYDQSPDAALAFRTRTRVLVCNHGGIRCMRPGSLVRPGGTAEPAFALPELALPSAGPARNML
ncbi:hypothetical protein NUW54_g14029 [Trametes sanguinea]|uniref:Uncharacterized protein n=1 Tax=Trametes sanguinea TaxID=158606 RepID=A0ACC1MG98_9APHY|nr:hypothetical protein NUW54_g14029 [Trametes sanguinea]